MAIRLNRDPTYDLGRHIATGEKVPLSGDPICQDKDNELDRNDPMDSWTAPRSLDEITQEHLDDQIKAANAGNATGLMSDTTSLDSQSVDVEEMNGWSDSP